ncbi:MAG TPA: hypothetical protein VHZ24_09505 [Pirellulales bacterium]|nr:hypothetical protein [Pirellulales bacterium]
MERMVRITAVVIAMTWMMPGPAPRAQTPYGGTCASACCGPCSAPSSLLQRFAPAGGWHPDGGRLLHWWNPCCFPHCGVPDDYCRKPMPCICWGPCCRQ